MKDNLVEWTENIFKIKKIKWEQHYFGYHHLTYLNLLTFVCFCFFNALLIVYYYYNVISIWRHTMWIASMCSRVVVSRPHHHHYLSFSLPLPRSRITSTHSHARPGNWKRFELHSCSGNGLRCDAAGMGCCQRRRQLGDQQRERNQLPAGCGGGGWWLVKFGNRFKIIILFAIHEWMGRRFAGVSAMWCLWCRFATKCNYV